VWTPNARVVHNPGREQLTFQFQPVPCDLQGLERLCGPLQVVGLGDDVLPLFEFAEDGARQRFTFQAGETTVVLQAWQGLPERLVSLDGDQALVLAEYRYGPSADDPQRFAPIAVETLELFRDAGAQLRSRKSTLSDVRLAAAPPRLEVGPQDNVFEISPGAAGSNYVGKAAEARLPAPIAACVRVAEIPRVLWRR
jgi:hypothetical protein